LFDSTPATPVAEESDFADQETDVEDDSLILGSDFEDTDADQEFESFTPETAAPASMSSSSWAGADALELNTPAEDDVPVPAAAPVDVPAASERVAPRIPTGGTLFERMSNLSRGLSRSDDENKADDDASSVNIPRFLDRQNN
jgi:cell division protein FtsZ